MANIRRSARELALKALFQIEVGRQPLIEVLPGTMDQVRILVRNPIAHTLRDVQTDIKTVTARHIDDMSVPSARQLRMIARGCSRQVLILVDALAEQVDEVTDAEAPIPLASGRAAAVHAQEQLDAGLAKMAMRETLYPDAMREVIEAAARGGGLLVRAFERHLPAAVQIAAFARSLVSGVLDHRDTLDAVIAQTATGWRLDRLAAVDRNILRLGAYELLHCPAVPAAAAINEAVELAKRYSTAESGRFVNGVLGALPRTDANREKA